MGKRILVTRPHHQSANLCSLIEQKGWQAVKFPVIEIRSKTLSDKDRLCLQHIEQYQYVFFVSVNAVNFAYEILNYDFGRLKQVKCVAVGLATYNQLAQYAMNNILLPEAEFNSEGILSIPELQDLGGQSCLIIRGAEGRELLANTLHARGASVDYMDVYIRAPVFHSIESVNLALDDGNLDAVFIYSVEALHNLVALAVKVKKVNNLLLIPLVVISRRVYAMAKDLGFTKIVVANKATDVAMINALNNGENCGGSN
ncbi:MAG: uroporphyrinogen-III synthase [Methyloprofundus sp.]|nr:uroporphyrinogen-III synthase [Methyloprofundus sp.]